MARFLDGKLARRRVNRVELSAISALKTFDPPVDELVGREIGSVSRKGKFLILEAGGPGPLWLVVHLARGGWIRWSDQVSDKRARPGKGPLALRLAVEEGGGIDVTEAGTEKKLSIWVVKDLASVAPLSVLGPDPLSGSFDLDAMRAAMAGQTGNVKKVLTDQEVVAGVGNAYSDEILHAAKLSPFKPVRNLGDEELRRLHAETVRVLRAAVERSAGLPASGLKAEKRSGMQVHGRTGEPCPVCGERIREVSFSGRSLQYCPGCQTGGRPLADRRLSRLLR